MGRDEPKDFEIRGHLYRRQLLQIRQHGGLVSQDAERDLSYHEGMHENPSGQQ
jgi:hypothetical protein